MTLNSPSAAFVDLSSADIADYVTRLGAFVAADIAVSRSPNNREARLAIQDAAGRVRPDCTRPDTVAVLVRSLMKRAYSQIYEQYAARMVDEVERCARSLDPLVARAVRIHSGVRQLRRAARYCSEAVAEAYNDVYGDDRYEND